MAIYELKAINQKNFYGKAIVKVSDSFNFFDKTPAGTKTLYSYNTAVIRMTPDKKIKRLWGGYSATTMRHVNAFLTQEGFQQVNKKQWFMLPYESTPQSQADAWAGVLYR